MWTLRIASWTALAGVADPERKRKIIGKLFIEIFEEEAKKFGEVDFLARERCTLTSSNQCRSGDRRLRSRHTTTLAGLPEKMHLKLIEPFRELFKDEVRAVGHELGLPDELIWRHPFPGPGPGCARSRRDYEGTPRRCYGRRMRSSWRRVKKAGLYRDIWQGFVVLLPVKCWRDGGWENV
jgi:GMP synthase (glutamine-hydrolysing)